MSLKTIIWCYLLQSIVFAATMNLEQPVISIEPRANITDFLSISKISPLIVGGTNVPFEGYATYQVSLQVNGGHRCGGSIIAKNWILTAAHCISDGAPIEVLAGTNTWRSGGQRYRSKMYYIHGWYNNPKNAYDVGLIRIDGDIQYNDKVNWIALWPDAPPSGTWLVATGWGSIGEAGAPDVLQKLDMRALSPDECRQRGLAGHESHLCAENGPGHGVCFGDSGGPITWGGMDNYALVGVANFVINGCGGGFPDGFASVSNLFDWIVKNSWESGN